MEDPYARCSWIIPVRGSLPWQSCSTASLQPEGPDCTCAIVPTTLREGLSVEIAWTRDAMLEFWKFLTELRTAGRLGPLGLSFHAAPTAQHLYSMPTTVPRNETTSAVSAQSSTAENGGITPTSQKTVRTTVQSTDHFKVYHDAPQAMLLRAVLDAWVYQCREGNGADNGAKKVRLLKGVTLVLVDELSQGILTC